uniref:Endonuclease/exonuclease/phosphatase domain-containing protein n=1 Tax=Paramormyrops kingsleyae TaxID=1676925 RepID=A0A3B3QT71_9TELE
MANKNIASWNIRALNTPEKRSSVTDFLKRQHVDLAFLIETHLLQVVSTSSASSRRCGVAILVRRALQILNSGGGC